jgi:flagellin-like protein
MKANRKFVEDEEAVSAVIGVILMVAITVAIAATVYVYVSGMLGGGPTASPTVGMTQVQNYISIQEVQRGPVSIAACTVNVVDINGTSVTAAGAQIFDIDVDTYLSGGDTITFDSTWVTTAANHTGSVPYTISVIYSDDSIGTAQFTPI